MLDKGPVTMVNLLGREIKRQFVGNKLRHQGIYMKVSVSYPGTGTALNTGKSLRPL
jgi:hypothetical protein